MPRVRLEACNSYEFIHRLMVRATDLNYAGHLGNEALLGLVHEARSRLMAQLDFDTIGVNESGVGLAIADLAVNFKSEVFAHDRVEIDSHIGEISEKSFRLFHRLRRGDEVVALVETGVVAYDYHAHSVTALPEAFFEALENDHIQATDR